MKYRLKKRKDFQSIAASGLRFVASHFIVQFQKGQDFSRFGVVASRKVGGSVQRNRAKRRLRVIGKQLLMLPSSMDFVLIARSSLAEAPFHEIQREIGKAIQFFHRKGYTLIHNDSLFAHSLL